jgi:hypothetical protein
LPQMTAPSSGILGKVLLDKSRAKPLYVFSQTTCVLADHVV